MDALKNLKIFELHLQIIKKDANGVIRGADIDPFQGAGAGTCDPIKADVLPGAAEGSQIADDTVIDFQLQALHSRCDSRRQRLLPHFKRHAINPAYFC
jgi:hypothetical protein